MPIDYDLQGQELADYQTAPYWGGAGMYVPASGQSPYKRSGKTLNDLLRMYRLRVRGSKKWRQMTYDKTWLRMVDLYKGKHFVLSNPGQQDDRIAINIAFATVNTIVPSIAVNEPIITVNPRDPSQADSATQLEAAINYWWRRYKWKLEVKRAVKDSIITGNGWVKLGWLYTEKKRPLTQQEHAAQIGQLQAQVAQAAMADPAIAADLPTDDDVAQGVDTDTWDVTHDHAFVERCSPFDVFIDPEATCDGDLKWIAQRIVAPIERVKKDKRYKKSGRDSLQADLAQNPRWRDYLANNTGRLVQDGEERDDIKRVTLWEYWDVQNEYYCVFPELGDSYLVDPTDFPYPFGHPFVHLGNYEVTDQFYSVGDLENIEPIQQELNGVRSDMMNHRKRWQRAYLAKRDKLDAEAISVLASDEDGRVIFVDGDENLTEIVVPLAQTALDPQMYQYSQTIEDDLDLVSGVSEYQRGSIPETTRTATEANMIQSNTDARVADKLAQVEEFMGTIAERIAQLAQVYLTQDEVARIVGPDGKQQWVQFSRDDIQGEYDFTIEAGSTTPKDDATNRGQAIQLVQALNPYVGSVVDPHALVAYMLKSMFNIKDPSEFLMQQQPQQQPAIKDIVNINYKDMPPDSQRQVEQQLGLQPSQVGGSSPQEQAQADQQQQDQQAQQDQAMQQQQGQQQQLQSAQENDQQMRLQQQQYVQQLRAQELTQLAQKRGL